MTQKARLGKIQTMLLVVVSIALIITSVQLYREKQKNDRQYKTFLNQFYFSLDSTISSLDFILDEKSLEGRDLKEALARVDQDLDITQLVLDSGSLYVDHDILSHNSIFRHHPVKQFAANDELMTEEEQYLKNLKSDLDRIYHALQLDGTMQEDSDLKVDEFNDIVTGRGLDSSFLTMDKFLDVPFQIIDQDEVPDRILKWLAKSKSVEQRKVFRVNNKTYVLIIPNSQKDAKQATITNIAKRSGGITVNYENQQPSRGSERNPLWVVAELEGVGNRFFQFATQDESTEEIEGKNNELHVQSIEASVELIIVEELSKDGEVME